jgi:HK97 family phage portal protein
MSKRKRKFQGRADTPASKPASSIGFLLSDEAYKILCGDGYRRLDKNPDIVAAMRAYADVISSMTVQLMANTAKGDVRIRNELSRHLDITPSRYMTRKTFVDAVVMNLLLHGDGNAVVKVHTDGGYLGDFEPIDPLRVGFQADGYGYKIIVDGVAHEPDDFLHFVHNPDPRQPWCGQGFRVALRDVARNLAQARETENAFMSSKWKPSLIIRADSSVETFNSKAGRNKLLEEYFENAQAGKPWMIPADLFDVKEVRPLSLADLAINDTVKIDKQTVAAITGVPAFLLGVGQYTQVEWNSWIQNRVKPIAQEIAQELTRKIIISEKWYIRFNTWSILDWDLGTVATVFGSLSDRAIVSGNEVRDRIGMEPREGLDELRLLENYIPLDKLGDQKKLNGGSDNE